MNKFARLYKRLTRSLITSLIIVLGAVGFYLFADNLEENTASELARMRTQLSFKQTEVNTISNQLENAKDGEAQFLEYLLSRENHNFFMNVEEVKKQLRKLQTEYVLSEDLKLTLSTEAELNDPAFRSLPHVISLRKDAKLTFSALSDLHVFSLLEALSSQLPGIIEFTRVTITKKKDLNASALARISTGAKADLIDAELQFNWYSFNAKNQVKSGAE